MAVQATSLALYSEFISSKQSQKFSIFWNLDRLRISQIIKFWIGLFLLNSSSLKFSFPPVFYTYEEYYEDLKYFQKL